MYTIKIFDRIDDVPRDQWDSLTEGQSYTFSFQFWEMLQSSSLNDFSYRHALVYDSNAEAVALTTFYTLTTDVGIFSTGWIKKTLKTIRKVYPNFLKLTMLECGTPITVNKPFIIKKGSNEVAISNYIASKLNDVAKTSKALIIVIRDFKAESEHIESGLRRSGYHIVKNLPNTYLDVKWQTHDDYVNSLRSHYRRKYLINKKINEQQGVRCVLHDDFSELSETLCKQWLVIHDNAKEFQREKLTPKFYEQFSTMLGTRSKVLLFYKRNELVGHVLLLADNERLRWLHVGRNESARDHLYFYMLNKIVETAIQLKFKELELSLSTYEAKTNVGAIVEPLNMAIKSVKIPNFLIGSIYRLLNKIPDIEDRRIFK